MIGTNLSQQLLETPIDKNSTIYKIYVVYGLAMLLVFNTIYASLFFFIKSMPNYSPSFFLNFGLNILIIVTVLIVFKYGHFVSFKLRNNFMMLVLIPLTIGLPLGCHLFQEDEAFKFFLTSLFLIGVAVAVI